MCSFNEKQLFSEDFCPFEVVYAFPLLTSLREVREVRPEAAPLASEGHHGGNSLLTSLTSLREVREVRPGVGGAGPPEAASGRRASEAGGLSEG